MTRNQEPRPNGLAGRANELEIKKANIQNKFFNKTFVFDLIFAAYLVLEIWVPGAFAIRAASGNAALHILDPTHR
jgi:hypothetical protein